MTTKVFLAALWTWFLTDPVGQTTAVLTALANVWQAVPAPWREALERRAPRAVGTLRMVVEILPSFVGALFAFVWQVLRGVAKADAQSGRTPPPGGPRPPTLPLAALQVVYAIGFAAMLAIAAGLTGCPRLPEPDGCTPRDQRCHNGAPEVCSQTQRWTPADRPCGELGAGVVCCATVSPYGRRVHACVPQGACASSNTDGGVE
jgi:hypothetical protein